PSARRIGRYCPSQSTGNASPLAARHPRSRVPAARLETPSRRSPPPPARTAVRNRSAPRAARPLVFYVTALCHLGRRLARGASSARAVGRGALVEHETGAA